MKKCILKVNNISNHIINKEGVCVKCEQDFWRIKVINNRLIGL